MLVQLNDYSMQTDPDDPEFIANLVVESATDTFTVNAGWSLQMLYRELRCGTICTNRYRRVDSQPCPSS